MGQYDILYEYLCDICYNSLPTYDHTKHWTLVSWLYSMVCENQEAFALYTRYWLGGQTICLTRCDASGY